MKIKPRDTSVGFFINFLFSSIDKTIASKPSSLNNFLSLIKLEPVEPIPSPSM